jgi:hypothetical protein
MLVFQVAGLEFQVKVSGFKFEIPRKDCREVAKKARVDGMVIC